MKTLPDHAFLPASLRRSDWLAAMLDEIDYGMLLVAHDGTVLHCNHAALRHLEDAQSLCTRAADGRRSIRDHDGLRAAIAGAALRGLRKLVFLGRAAGSTTIAVVPLGPAESGDESGVALLVLGKRCVCDRLTVECYAMAHGLTPAETRVLRQLAEGDSPAVIALHQGVGLATVRTQISQIREKTGTPSIDALIRGVAVLPPLLAAIGRPSRASAAAAPA